MAASPLRSIISGSIGNLVEWYDWYVCSAFTFASSAGVAFGLLAAALLVVSAYTSISAVVRAELFPTQVQALGVGLPYALTAAIFGGTAEYLVLFAKEQGREE